MADLPQIESDCKVVTDWAAGKKISLECIKIIIDMGFTSMEALACLGKDDLKKATGIPVGQQKLLLRAIAGLDNNSCDREGEINTTPEQVEGHVIQQSSAPHPVSGTGEEAFAARLMASMGQSATGAPLVQPVAHQVPLAPVTGNISWQDPQVHLKSLASTKSNCYEIVDFVDAGANLSEKVLGIGDDYELVCRSGNKKPKLESLSMAQWSAANLAILYKLVQEGSLEVANIFDYLSHTSLVYKLLDTHEMTSVFFYDREYRRLQHTHQFRWGTAANHLAPSFLRLKSYSHGYQSSLSGGKPFASGNNGFRNNQHYSGDKQSFKPNFASHTGTGKVICKRFNGAAGCSMKGCKFEHVCNVPGCGALHPGARHSESKNF